MTTTVSQRVQKHRDGLRASGLRPVQIWLPDTRHSNFARECRRQSRLIKKADAQEADVLDWLQAVADTQGWK